MRALICITRSRFNKNKGTLFGNKLKLVGTGRESYVRKHQEAKLMLGQMVLSSEECHGLISAENNWSWRFMP